MADNTKIEWADATWNVITGCQVLSPGCTNCYAMKLAGNRMRSHPTRQGLTQATKAGPVWNGQVRFNEQMLDQPLRWRTPRRIFVAAHGDLFYEAVPDDWIDRVFAVMALAPQHVYLVLTKRADRMRDYVAADRMGYIEGRAKRLLRERSSDPGKPVMVGKTLAGTWPWPHVWLGVSAEDQTRADERIPALLATPAARRFVSLEPLLGPIDLAAIRYVDDDAEIRIDALTAEAWVENSHSAAAYTDQADGNTHLDWVIVGGESGPDARPMHPQWARDLRDQCQAPAVAFFYKQTGEWRLKPAADGDETWPAKWHKDRPPRPDEIAHMERVGKKTAGRLLDGITWDQVPA
jgi:protein gp37